MEQPTEEAATASSPPPQPPMPPTSDSEPVAALMAQVNSIVSSNTFKVFQALMTAHEEDVEEERNATTRATEETAAVKAELEKSLEEVSALKMELSNNDTELKKSREEVSAVKTELDSNHAELEKSREEVSSLKMEFDSNHEELEKLANKVKDLESEAENLRNEMSSKDEALAAASAEILQFKTQMEEAHTARSTAIAELDKAQKDLAASSQDIALKSSRFQGLEDFMFPLVEASREEITQHLHNLFLDAYSLVDTFFNDDFDGPTLANKTTWSHFLKHKVAGQLPLPRSNSAVAKRMRVAAVMGVLTDALVTRLFQPTYLLEDSNEVSELLDAMLLEDDEDDEDDEGEGGSGGGGVAQERHLRASLLRFDAAQQDANGQARESRVAQDVYGLASRLLPLARQADFARRLGLFCRRARDAWKWIQRLGPRVEPTLDPEDADTWLLLPAARSADAGHPPPSPPGDDTRAAAAAPGDIKLVVWPGFLIQGPEDAELVGEGFVVDKSQAQAAADEEQSQRGHRKGSRSGARPGAAATNGNGAMLHKRVSSSEPDELSDDG